MILEMQLFLVILNKENASAWGKIEENNLNGK